MPGFYPFDLEPHPIFSTLTIFGKYFPGSRLICWTVLNEDRVVSWKKQCLEIMANEVSIVKIRLETNKYMKTIKDRRLSFADKLAAFGK